jgi:two-component system NarL family response regulator
VRQIHIRIAATPEILSLLANRKTNQEIAEALYITPGTVRVHVHAILHKLGVSDRHAAVMIAIQKQLIQIKD